MFTPGRKLPENLTALSARRALEHRRLYYLTTEEGDVWTMKREGNTYRWALQGGRYAHQGDVYAFVRWLDQVRGQP